MLTFIYVGHSVRNSIFKYVTEVCSLEHFRIAQRAQISCFSSSDLADTSPCILFILFTIARLLVSGRPGIAKPPFPAR